MLLPFLTAWYARATVKLLVMSTSVLIVPITMSRLREASWKVS